MLVDWVLSYLISTNILKLKRVRKIFLIFIFLFFYNLIFSQGKEKLINDIFSQLNISKTNFAENFFRVKKLTQNNFVVLVPIYIADKELPEEAGVYDFYILVVNSKNKVLSKTFKKGFWYHDAVYLNDIEIIIPKFKLSNEDFNFILKSSHKSSSRVNLYYTDEFSIFVTRGKKIKNILKNYVVKIYRNENNGLMTDMEEEEIIKELSVSNNQSNKFKNLIFKSRIKTSITKNDSLVSEKIRTTRDTLKFNGTTYSIID